VAGRASQDVRVASDSPAGFSAGVAQSAGGDSPLGPYFLHRSEDDVVVGEIGGGFVGAGTVEIGYAVGSSRWGRGFATDVVRALVARARGRSSATPGLSTA
jgi:RimJ/RimL family protein N-acetyltransferase